MLNLAITTHVVNNRLTYIDHRGRFLTCLLTIFLKITKKNIVSSISITGGTCYALPHQ